MSGRSLGHLGREGLEACTNLIGGTLVWMLTQTHVDTQTRTRQQYQRIIVELGPNVHPHNLFLLATTFPDAKIYGIEKNSDAVKLLRMLVSASHLGNRIEIVEANYAHYTGPLQSQADIVVAIAPNPNASIDQGIRTFIKPGGQVQVVTELRSVKDVLASQLGGKGIIREVQTVNGPAEYTVIGASMGVPFTSDFLYGSDIWDIYVPSW